MTYSLFKRNLLLCYTLFCLLFFSANYVNSSDKINLVWNQKFSGLSSKFTAVGLTIDNNMNIYIAGNDYSSNQLNYILVKYNNDGQKIWDVLFENIGNQDGKLVGIVSDKQGNIFAVGTVSGQYRYEIILIKYNKDGQLQFSRNYQNHIHYNRHAQAKSLLLSPTNDIYILGVIEDSLYLHDYLLLKYDNNGNLKWKKTFTSSKYTYDVPVKMKSYMENGILIAGWSYTVYESPIQYQEISILRYDSTGSLVWKNTNRFDRNKWVRIYDLEVDNENNSYICGIFDKDNIIKTDKNGANVLRMNDYPTEIVSDIALDSDNNIYSIGQYFTKYNKNGEIVWENDPIENVKSLKIDKFGNIFVLADNIYDSFWTYIYDVPAEIKLHNISLMKYDSSGFKLWRIDYNSNNYLEYVEDYGVNFAFDDSCFIYILGNTTNIAKKYSNSNFNWFQEATTLKYSHDETNVTNFQETHKTCFLYQNYPNPFNSTTLISFFIPSQETVLLKVFNTAGKEIKTLINEKLESGQHHIKFNAKELPSGLYFYRLTTERFTKTNKFILIR